MKEGADLNLAPFRRRIRLLRAWRCAALGGSLGAGVALILATLDWLGIRYATAWALAVPVAAGIVLGILKAATERYAPAALAASVDRRSGLEDRLTTAAEVPSDAGPMAGALHHDAAAHLAGLRPAHLYPVRFGRWHGTLFILCAMTAILFALGNSDLFRTAQGKKDAAEMRREAVQVERVAKPILRNARLPEATAQDRELARNLKRFSRDLKRARMTKQQALVRANELAEKARRMEASRALSLQSSVQKAQTAAAQLGKMAAMSNVEKSDAVKLSEAADAAEQEIAAAQKKLGEKGLSKAQRAALEAKLAAAQKRLQNIRLSQRAEEMLRKLQANKDFQEAQKLLAKLAEQAATQQAGQGQAMTPEEMEADAKRLEALAKQLSSDAALKEYARQLLEAAQQARLAKNGKCSGGLMMAMGVGGLSLGMGGKGGPSPDKWVGAHGSLSRTDKSSLLHVKFQDRVLTSQRGQGPSTYTEVLGPSAMGAKSAVPYQAVLPKYVKSAESALQKSDIPPAQRRKVRDYFDSLRK